MKIFGFALSCFALAHASESALQVTYFVRQQPNLIKELENVFHEVSNPDHPRYTQYLTHEQVIALQKPLGKDLETVLSHVKSLAPLSVKTTTAGDKVVAVVPAGAYPDGSATQEAHRGAKSVWAALPSAVHDAVDTVVVDFLVSASPPPAVAQPKINKQFHYRHYQNRNRSVAVNSSDPMDCLKDRVDPPCLRKAYGIAAYKGSAAQNMQTVVVNQGYKQADLSSFLSEYNLPQQKIVKDVGVNTGQAGDEASLDTQFIIAAGQLVPTWWVYINGHSANPFSLWTTWASNTSEIPWVHSLSVGEPEGEFAADNTMAGVQRMNTEMMALGTRGVSVVFASGDSGYQQQQKYGSSSPYVTSVGGVFNGDLGNDVLQVDPITTGGFSSLPIHPIQPWQTAAVDAYVKTEGERPAFNASRRCCPDLSVYDAGYYIVQDGSDTVIGGTSAAAPVFSGMVSLINDALFNKNLKPMGFLNYFLYKNEAAFLDIIHGDNTGFAAVKGYDPASGLGTFDSQTFSKLLTAAEAAQRKHMK